MGQKSGKNEKPPHCRTLIELDAGILVWGILIWLVSMLLVHDRVRFTVGLIVGVAMAVFMAGHMYHAINRATEMVEKDAEGYMKRMAVARLLVLFLAAVAVHFLQIGDAVAVFIGAFTLKFGAYSQPLIHRVMEKLGK